MKKKKLSIIIPVFNESQTLTPLLKKIENVRAGMDKEIIIVDDGSTDSTRRILVDLRRRYKVIFKEKNEGKGSALKAGIANATGDFVIFQDADLEYDPYDYPAMIQPILDGKTEAVMGVRAFQDKIFRHKSLSYWLSWFGNEIITWTTNFLFSNKAGEYEGCYKAFTKQLLSKIEVKTNGFAYDNELVCKILKKGYKTVDVPIHYYPRTYEQGKKIKAKDGFIILWTIIKCRFVD